MYDVSSIQCSGMLLLFKWNIDIFLFELNLSLSVDHQNSECCYILCYYSSNLYLGQYCLVHLSQFY